MEESDPPGACAGRPPARSALKEALPYTRSLKRNKKDGKVTVDTATSLLTIRSEQTTVTVCQLLIVRIIYCSAAVNTLKRPLSVQQNDELHQGLRFTLRLMRKLRNSGGSKQTDSGLEEGLKKLLISRATHTNTFSDKVLCDNLSCKRKGKATKQCVHILTHLTRSPLSSPRNKAHPSLLAQPRPLSAPHLTRKLKKTFAPSTA